jgi:hypothetical protein
MVKVMLLADSNSALGANNRMSHEFTMIIFCYQKRFTNHLV